MSEENLMLEEKVKGLLEEVVQENPDLFLIDLDVNAENHIRVVMDGDQGISVNDCMEVSRKIENNLNREETDFSLEVTSAGAGQPLLFPRQFKKNIGRKLSIKTKDKVFEAELVGATDKTISVEWKTREPKPVGKGKITVKNEAVIDYTAIVEAKVMIKF